MITIIDYGSGNLKSIKNGFLRIGVDTLVSGDVQEMAESDALILPGVGAFGSAMEHLEKYREVIKNHLKDGKPFFGVCLGLQVLFTESEESPGSRGLDIFNGKVLHFPESITKQGMKIPHMGWNNLKIQAECPILEGVGPEYMYFVHSYYVEPEDKDIIAATVDYGVDVPAVICQKNVFATQFHPEKSGESGLQILKNFVELV